MRVRVLLMQSQNHTRFDPNKAASNDAATSLANRILISDSLDRLRGKLRPSGHEYLHNFKSFINIMLYVEKSVFYKTFEFNRTKF
jgi:hypothetical protein